jgi:hypothetical protein
MSTKNKEYKPDHFQPKFTLLINKSIPFAYCFDLIFVFYLKNFSEKTFI